MIAEISSTVTRGTSVVFSNFVSFQAAEASPRKARDPRNGETVHLPARRVVKVRIMDSFRSMVRDQDPERSLRKKTPPRPKKTKES